MTTLKIPLDELEYRTNPFEDGVFVLFLAGLIGWPIFQLILVIMLALGETP